MSQPVWILSVDLQTKTATFQSGMANAARSARDAFKDIKNGAQEMSEGTSRGFGDIRHSLGLLDNSIRGAHGAAMADAIRLAAQWVDISGALPFAAMAGGFLLIGGAVLEVAKKIREMREEQQKLKDEQTVFGTELTNVFNGLDRKLLEAGIKADELSKNHLAALHKQLELIDFQSMDELVHSFEKVDKAADTVFAQLKANWYSLGIGSEGAKHALDEFKIQYDSLIAQGKDKEAADLLKGTRESAQHILEMQKQAASGVGRTSSGSFSADDAQKYNQFVAIRNELQKAGVGFTEKEVQAQEALVRALDAQVDVQHKVDALKNLQKSNARQETDKVMTGELDARLKAQFEAERKAQEEEDKLREEAHNRAVTQLEQSEKEKIEITDKASAERLAAIDAAIKEEERYGLQETSFYRELLNQRLTEAKAMQDEEDKQAVEAGKEAADHAAKMAEIALAAQKEHQQLLDSARHVSDAQRVSEAIRAANEDYRIKATAFSQEIAALDKHGKDYENKLRAIQDKQKQLSQQHENEITAIEDQATRDRNKRVLDAEMRYQDEIARGLTSTLMRHQSFASMMASIGDQVVSGMMQNAIKSILANDMTKESDAAAAARKAFNAGLKFPFPANIVMGPALAAMAFASVMAFESGGIVPGVGKGDIVPAMLTPGEAVLPKGLTEGLTKAANTGNIGGGTHYTVHVHQSHTIHALDSDGVSEVLDRHSDKFQKHFENTLRRMNK